MSVATFPGLHGVRLTEWLLDAETWSGPDAPAMLAALRSAVRPWARTHRLEVDDAVSLLWEAAQDPWVGRAQNPSAALLSVASRAMVREAEGARRMVGEREASRSPVGSAALRAEIAEVEAAIASAYECDGLMQAVDLERRRARLRSQLQTLGAPIRGGETLELLLDHATSDALDDEDHGDDGLGGLEVAIRALVAAGWARRRAERVVEAAATRAGAALRESAGTGAACAANRLRRDAGTPGLLGLSRSQWLAVVRLVVGSRKGTPGAVERVAVHGEDMAAVLGDPAVQHLARQATGPGALETTTVGLEAIGDGVLDVA